MKAFNQKISIVIGLIVMISTSLASNKDIINNYHRTFIPCHDSQGQLQIAIRLYEKNSIPYFLAVNPYTFDTKTIPVSSCAPHDQSERPRHHFTMATVQNTPYIKALNQYTSPPYQLANDGLIQAEYPINGMFLTIDMCPSTKFFEENFFKTLVALSDQLHRPIPIALSVSGLWMIGHPQEFAWLIQQQKANKLQITWINHSFSHPYYMDLPLNRNFLLTGDTKIDREILDTEKILIQNQLVPSVFFRFPGLISDQQLILKLREYGLIPVGSNAWLAKGEQPKNGSIILVHGNSNEPEGIAIIMPLLKRTDVHWLPLSKAFKAKGGYSPPLFHAY